MASLEEHHREEEREVPSKPVPEVVPSPRWFKVICALCWILILASAAGVLFITPAFSSTPSQETEVVPEEEEEVASSEVSEDPLDSTTVAATQAIEANFSAEEAEEISDEAYDLAKKIAEAEANIRTNVYDDAAHDSWLKKLQGYLSAAPDEAVTWYLPGNDVEFSWDTFQPYIFDADKVANDTPQVRVLWLARKEDGTVLAWAKASYDPELGSFVDFERGTTSDGAALIPSDPQEGDNPDDVMMNEMQGVIEGLKDINPVLPDEKEVTEEDKQEVFRLRYEAQQRQGNSND